MRGDGIVNFKKPTCPICGATMGVNKKNKYAFCPSCGARISIGNKITQLHHDHSKTDHDVSERNDSLSEQNTSNHDPVNSNSTQRKWIIAIILIIFLIELIVSLVPDISNLFNGGVSEKEKVETIK